MRIEQYLTHIDYALWEIIVNGDAPIVASASAKDPIPPKTAEQKLARKNELKVKSTLLLVIPDEHLLKFHGIKDAKTLWEAIKTRSLPSAWNNIALIMRNKADLDGLSMDDLYNLKVYEADIKNQSSSSSNSQNVAFVSSDDTSSTNEEVNIVHDVHAASPQLDNEDLEQIDTDDLEEMDRRGHFARECKAPRNQGNRNGDAPRRIVPVETLSNALVVQDGIGGYDWSFQAEEGPTDFALIAHLSSDSSSSSSSDSEVHTCSKDCLKSYETLQKQYDQQRDALKKSNLEIIGYQLGLESLEARIIVHQKNETVYEEDIAFLKYDVKIEEENNQVNDRFKKVEGYHAVPPPYTRNYMPSRPDLSFGRLDDSVYKTNVSETISSVSRIESTAPKSSKDSLEQPKDVRPSAPIIKEWESDSDDDSVFRPKSDQTKPKLTKINFFKSDENVKTVNKENTHKQEEYLRKSQSPRVDKRNWNGIMTQKLGDGFELNKKACFVCGSLNHLIKDCNFYENKMVRKSVVTKPGQVPVNAAKQSSPRAAALISTARPVNTVSPKSKVNDALLKTYSYFKAHSPVRRIFNQKSAAKTNNLNKKVYTAKVNNVTTAGPEVVVSTAEGKRKNAGNPQYALQDQGIFDSECSRHMTGNKSYLTNYQDIDGGFVAFAGSPKGGKITVKDLNVLCSSSPDIKQLMKVKSLLKVPRQNNKLQFLDLKNVVPQEGLYLLICKGLQ
ncbi:hypothetical protein Tco_1185095 [Tanacetum coccineum]